MMSPWICDAMWGSTTPWGTLHESTISMLSKFLASLLNNVCCCGRRLHLTKTARWPTHLISPASQVTSCAGPPNVPRRWLRCLKTGTRNLGGFLRFSAVGRRKRTHSNTPNLLRERRRRRHPCSDDAGCVGVVQKSIDGRPGQPCRFPVAPPNGRIAIAFCFAVSRTLILT